MTIASKDLRGFAIRDIGCICCHESGACNPEGLASIPRVWEGAA